jgi:hypothetical protein
MSRRLGTAAAVALVACLASDAAAEVVPATRAGEVVGREATIEGRVAAVYDSPLATVLAFAPNFAGFTATILAADRGKFPRNVEEHYRGKLVRLTGAVTAYRGKPEMQVRDLSQVTIVVDPDLTPTPAATRTAPAPTPHAEVEDMQRAIAALEERVGVLEARLAGAEQMLAAQNAPPPRPSGLAVGADAPTVRAALGPPHEVQRNADGGSVWLYGTGRTVTFDAGGLVVVWTGFVGS